jgi:hypothetical protein
MEFRKEHARRAHQRNHKLKGEASELLNTLEVKIVQRKAQRDKITEDFVKLCHVGIKRVKGVQKENVVSSSEIMEVSRKTILQSCWIICRLNKECLSIIF